MKQVRISVGVAVLVLLLAMESVRAAERFPPPDFESGYQVPSTQQPLPRADWQEYADVGALILALSLASWIGLGARNRRAMVILSVFSLAYFGFYRGGCVCPIGAIQNVSLALADSRYVLPFTVVLFFTLPLLFALLFGRVFCGGVCPLGAIQDIVLIRPLRLPAWLCRALGVLPFVYLGASVLFAVTGTMFIICRYDPFVAFFRLSGPFYMLVAGGIVLLISAFVGRPYCRFLCPYGALLSVISQWSWQKVSITPDECVVCSLCEGACPFAAIRSPIPEGASDQ